MARRDFSLAPFLFLICASLLLAGAALGQRRPDYAGSDACVACHEEAADSIAASAHRKLAEESAPARRGCEACHGPGGKHVNSGGDKSLLFSFQEAAAEDIRARCGACHESDAAAAHTHRTTCLSCHAAHHYREKKFLLVKATPQLCTECHERR
jgi:predicted CXXCH cytochrome family protein